MCSLLIFPNFAGNIVLLQNLLHNLLILFHSLHYFKFEKSLYVSRILIVYSVKLMFQYHTFLYFTYAYNNNFIQKDNVNWGKIYIVTSIYRSNVTVYLMYYNAYKLLC